jgi:hypothetical protein
MCQHLYTISEKNILRKNSETAPFITIFEHFSCSVQYVTEVPKPATFLYKAQLQVPLLATECSVRAVFIFSSGDYLFLSRRYDIVLFNFVDNQVCHSCVSPRPEFRELYMPTD